MAHAIELFADSARGTSIPAYFAESHYPEKWDFSKCWPDSLKTIRGDITQDGYWDAWQDILDNATSMVMGNEYTLYQDGDLFCICENLMNDEEYLDFFGEARD